MMSSFFMLKIKGKKLKYHKSIMIFLALNIYNKYRGGRDV